MIEKKSATKRETTKKKRATTPKAKPKTTPRKSTEPVGRPRFFKDTPTEKQEMIDRIEEYFTKTLEAGKPLTVTGLALSLGMSRQTFFNYKNNEQFFDIISRARQVVEQEYEERLISGQASTGVIFGLKAIFGYRDGDNEKTDSNINLTIKNYTDDNKEDEEGTTPDSNT